MVSYLQLQQTIFSDQFDYNEGQRCAVETNKDYKRPLSTIINLERLEILSRQTKTIAKLNVVDKKATTGEPGVQVGLIVPYQLEV